MIINSDFQLQNAQRELSALLMQSTSINAVRIAEIQKAIHEYLSKR
jgi:chaperonin cofactor prefoldin